jgi:hypothetical protein
MQDRPLYLLDGSQVLLGQQVAKGAFGTVRLIKEIASPFFPTTKTYVGKLMTGLRGELARRDLAFEATCLGASHPSFVRTLGMTVSAPYMLIMEHWPQGNLGLYW